MDNQKQQVIERIKQANNILVTVSANPSVDQLASCLGLTIMLNEFGKHCTAVFSGAVPSTIEFLQPEKTLEKNTDSLRDFIIALDKSKADKLRYKVEDKVVKIFITPYHTSVSSKDLEFSQGDFNVEVVIALGVHEQKELDQAITANGRILHDATVISINTAAGGHIGTINWEEQKVSSLSEMIATLSESFDRKLLDNQVATALLTGIVSETNRFSNDKTTPEVMKVSAMLMAAGANQQLVATKLQEPTVMTDAIQNKPAPTQQLPDYARPLDGALAVKHDTKTATNSPIKTTTIDAINAGSKMPQIYVDKQGRLNQLDDQSISDTDYSYEYEDKPSGAPSPASDTGFIFGNTTPKNDKVENSHSLDALSLPAVNDPVINHSTQSSGLDGKHLVEPPQKPSSGQELTTEDNQQTTTNLPVIPVIPEPADVDNSDRPNNSVTIAHEDTQDVKSARDAVNSAIGELPPSAPLAPIAALNAQPLGSPLHTETNVSTSDSSAKPMPTNPNFNESAPASDSPSAQPLEFPSLKPGSFSATSSGPTEPNSILPPPPPVPPPMMPPSVDSNR